ncbi:hypothetical protein TRIUR3_34790 [Triticum urartu]|uniref:Uncharacterized protein n=1 Tax=Triticum urartu TaxID=4572 RepID=M7ZDH0_TRIUA|nr:hypothetical protein TRIUR3_34790 [Triticum urartu]
MTKSFHKDICRDKSTTVVVSAVIPLKRAFRMGVPGLEEVPERELGIHEDMELRSWRRSRDRSLEGQQGLRLRVLQERPELGRRHPVPSSGAGSRRWLEASVKEAAPVAG